MSMWFVTVILLSIVAFYLFLSVYIVFRLISSYFFNKHGSAKS